MTFLKYCFALFISISLVACGGGGSSTPVTTIPDREIETESDPNEELPDPEPETPVAINNFPYFPVIRGAQWHYENGDVVTFGVDREVAGATIAPLVHSSDGWADLEYFHADDDNLYFGGLLGNIDLSSIGAGVIYGELELDNLWRVYTASTDRGSSFCTPLLLANTTATTIPASQEVRFNLVCSSSIQAKERVFVDQFGDVPALRLDIRFSILTVGGGETSVWLSPGLGMVARSFGASGPQILLDHVIGVQTPTMFIFNQGQGVAQPAQQLTWNNVPITNDQLEVDVDYVGEESDWLAVEFDETGTWRASLTGVELPEGLHAAVVVLQQETEMLEVVVSVLVE